MPLGAKRARAETTDDDDATDQMIDTKFSSISADATEVEVAFKPIIQSNFQSNQRKDVVILLDLTCSMEGNGIIGLKTVVANFDRLLTQTMVKENLSAEDQTTARANMSVMFAFFGSAVGIFEGVDDFVSAESEQLNNCIELITPRLKCFMNYTNIEQGIEFAGNLLASRSQEKRLEDIEHGISRTSSIVLVTDGSANAGARNAGDIISRHVGSHKTTISSFEKQVSVFAIALGNSVNATFLSTLVDNTGFWHYAADPRDPSEAFEKTLGVIAMAKAPYVVRADVTVLRDGKEQATATTFFNFGMLTSKNFANPRIIGACVPAVQIGDKLRCTIKIGAFYTDSITVDVAETAVQSTGRLFVETTEIDASLAMLKKQMLDDPTTAYKNTISTYSSNPMALGRIQATMTLMATSQGFEDRDSFVNHLSAQSTMDYVSDPSKSSFDGSRSGSTPSPLPSIVHSVEASFSQSSFL